jgi:hypothetical protein
MTTPRPEPEDTLIELDDRRRVSLGKLGHHHRYLVHEEPDGTLVWTPAVVMPKLQADFLNNLELQQHLRTFNSSPDVYGVRRGRPRRQSASA